PLLVFGVAVLFVDSILLSCEHEQHDDEDNQRTLRGHVEAEREVENRNDDVVERLHEHVDDVAEEEPDPEMDEHQAGGLIPMGFLIGWSVGGLGHGSLPPYIEPARARNRRKARE